jgi:hypothetical protein
MERRTMKYNLIELLPRKIGLVNPWEVRFDNTDPHDREKRKIYTSSWGFLYYPRKWSIQKAFQKLKDDMISHREKEIEKLQRDIEMIREVELDEWMVESDRKQKEGEKK